MTDKEDPVESGAIGVADVFKDEVDPEPEKEPEPEPSKGAEPEPDPEPEPVKEEATAEPPSAEPKLVPIQAVLDARRRAQTAEARLAELEKQNASKDEHAPNPIDDPEGHEKYLRTKWEKERAAKVTEESRARMLETAPDYEEYEKLFLAMARSDTSLVEKLNNHSDPAKFAYETAKESKNKQYAEIEKQVIEKLRKEGKLKEKPSAPEVATLINSPGAGKNSDKPVKEITNVRELFAG
jgi:hypothetical protein